MWTHQLKPTLTFAAFAGEPLDELLKLQAPTFSSAREAFHQLSYVAEYASDLKCATLALESHYIDRDYMEDHSVFYSKALFPYENYCRRLHFFSAAQSDVEARLAQIVLIGAKEGRDAYIKACQEFSDEAYLGFCVIKPLAGSPVGRTVLRSFPATSTDSQHRRDFSCTRTYKAHLQGVELSVRGLAFQQQDVGVSACATTAIWSALHQAQMHEEIAIATPAQITTMAAKYSLPFGRSMPSEGLSLDQMCQAVQSLGLAPNLFRVDDSAELARAYLFSSVRSGVSPVLILKHQTSCHAVAVAGMKLAAKHVPSIVKSLNKEVADDRAGDLVAIYIHDDRRGPYLRADFNSKDGKPQLIIPPRNAEDQSETWAITHMIIPIHSKVRLSFSGLRQIALLVAGKVNSYRDLVNKIKPGLLDAQLATFNTWIVRAHKYVEDIFVDRPVFLNSTLIQLSTQLALARYLGVIRIEPTFSDPIDVLVDTTGTRRNSHCLGVVPHGNQSPHTELLTKFISKSFGDCPVVR